MHRDDAGRGLTFAFTQLMDGVGGRHLGNGQKGSELFSSLHPAYM
jgi:hypothetical protein